MLIPFLLLLNHFFSDFVFQTSKMAIRKATSVKWLTAHVCAYTLALCPFQLWIEYTVYGDKWLDIGWLHWASTVWMVLNFALHWTTDFFTSKLTSFLYKKHQSNPTAKFLFDSYEHWYYVTIGADQVIHYACLFFTYSWVVGMKDQWLLFTL